MNNLLFIIVAIPSLIEKRYRSFKKYIHSAIKSSNAICRAYYINNGNDPLLPIFVNLKQTNINKMLKNIIYSIIGARMRL